MIGAFLKTKSGGAGGRLAYIDILRTVFCLGVLFYHLGLVPGGFFSVCGFFVITGYTACISLDKEKIDLFAHYKKRFKRIYLPLIVTVFSVLLLCSVLDIFWVTIKPEVTSIIGGYNNLYQIRVGGDYFADAKDTPFLHLWYVSILLQFEVVFPIVFVSLKWLRAKKKRLFDPAVLSLFALTAAVIYFYVSFSKGDLSQGYYGSLERLFSLFFGIFIYYYKKGSSGGALGLKKAVFFVILSAMICGMFFFGSDTLYMAELMIGYSLLTGVSLCLAADIKDSGSPLLRPFEWFSSISYELYLIHYPVMIVFPAICKAAGGFEYNAFYVFLASLAVAFFLHVLFNVNKDSNPLLILMCVVLGFFTVYGGVLYAMEEDHTEEMNALKAQLALEEEAMEQRQQEYLAKLEEENKAWEDMLEAYKDEDYAEKRASAVRLCGIGDSILLGASPALYEFFPNFYCDAVISRPGLYVRDIMDSMKSRGILDEALLLHIGSNGGLWEPQMESIMNYANANGIQIFWYTVTNDKSYSVYCNDGIRELCATYSNAHLMDWEVYSYGHGEWFVGDGIHVNEYGAWKYASFAYDAIHSYYVEKYEKERQEMLALYEETENSRYSFYGGDLLLSLHEAISENFENASFASLQEAELPDLLRAARKDDASGLLARNMVFALDGETELDEETLKELFSLAEGKRLYIIGMVLILPDGLEVPENVSLMSLYDVLGDNKEYFHADRVHLSDEGIRKVMELFMGEIL
ncbi:MAG: acyltransferase family protein [Firmicutes bacterium]|nr:acyltransferase family protein [Bacillota bacterium]